MDSVGPSVVAPGWDMQDVLLRLGAVPGEYLTHIIMELCDEGTLQQAIGRKVFGGSRENSEARAKLRSLLKTAREVAAGMQHLHSLGIIRKFGMGEFELDAICVNNLPVSCDKLLTCQLW